MKKFIILIGFILFNTYCKAFHPFIDGDPVLYWMSDDSVLVDDTPITTFIAPFYYDEDGFTGYDAAIRVKVTGGDLSSPIFLNIRGDNETFDGTDGMPFSDGSDTGDYWGAGSPTGNKSLLTDSLTKELLDEYVFQMELGKYDEMQDWAFVTLAASDPKTFQQLADSGYIHITFDLNPPLSSIWNPNFYTHPPVPEPSTSLLTMIGLGLIGLMRKKRRTPYES